MSRPKTYAPRLAKTVHGGLRPQGGRRDAWWRRNLLAWLESLHMGARLGRGRNYAQQGQIKSITVSPGLIQAEGNLHFLHGSSCGRVRLGATESSAKHSQRKPGRDSATGQASTRR